MKVLLLGGYGVFGSRLALLLVRDGHRVTVAGRDLDAAQRLASELGCDAARMDRTRDLHLLKGHDAVIDAAGPFQTYGGDPYALPRAAIAGGLHYLDLCDDAGFCAGIAALDRDARDAGVRVVSGLSSVPAISSAAVRALAGRDIPRVIETAILPGNRSPRGLSVMTSILRQAGQGFPVWRGGRWTRARGWSDPATYILPGGVIRQGWQIDVPDLALFPGHFSADSVIFRAGLELGIMRYGLAAFAGFRRLLPIPVSGPIVRMFKVAADLLSPFGSGTGGMSVMVIAGDERRWWRLLAADGDGPFIPAVAARALLRRDSLDPGAAPALEAVTLDEIEAAMQDLRVRTERTTEPFLPIFPRVLGPMFDALPVAVRQTHLTADVSRWHGHATIRRGGGVWERMLGRIFGFPPPGENVPVTVVKTATRRGETWQRTFRRQAFRSHLAATPRGMTERFGPFTFLLGLNVKDGALHYPVVSARLGPLPLPGWLLPVSIAHEESREGRFRFDVRLMAPLTGALLVHYQGELVEDAGESPAPPHNAP